MIKKVWKLIICLNTFTMKKPMRKRKIQTFRLTKKTLKEENRSKVTTKVKRKREKKVRGNLETGRMKKFKINLFSKEMEPLTALF